MTQENYIIDYDQKKAGCSVGVISRSRGEHRPVSPGIARGNYRQGSDMMK